MNIDMKIVQINWTHRIGSFKKYDNNMKSKPIIVKLVQYANVMFLLKKSFKR